MIQSANYLETISPLFTPRSAALLVRLAIVLFGFSVFGESTRSFTGVTEPIKDATLSSTVPGIIQYIHFEEGDAVKKGDVLIELRKRTEELEVDRRKLIWESRAEVQSAQDKVNTLRVDLDGTRRLYESTKSVSKDELDKKDLEHKIAVSELEKLETAEEREKIEYEMALEQLDMHRIKSPMDGYVTETLLELGENCEDNQPLIRVVDTSQCYFVTHIEATKALNLALDQSVTLEIGSGPSATRVEGRISFISPIVDPASGLQKIKILFSNADGKVRPGVAGVMLVTADN